MPRLHCLDSTHECEFAAVVIRSRRNWVLAMDVYDRTDVDEFVQPLSLVVNELCPSCSPAGAAVMSQR